MPQPLRSRPGDRTEGGHEQLAKRPECAILIAQVACAWALLEDNLGSMFSLATGTLERTTEGHLITKGNRLATAAFHALESINARLSVIEASLELELPSAVAPFNALAADIRKCAKNRNKIVHSSWHTSDRYPADLIRAPHFGVMERWTARDLKSVIGQIDDQSDKIFDFISSCVALKKERHQEQGGQEP
jgi:hypothetical protein